MPGMNPLFNQYEVELDSIELPDAAVIGRIGGGVGMALEWMSHGRVAIAARAVGLSRWALGVARRHAHDRVVSGARLDDKQHIREFIVRSHVKIEAARALVGAAAAALDEGRLAAREAAVAKLYATESACEVIDDAIQVLGGRGWLTEYRLAEAYGEARMFRLVDGASEVLKESIFHLLPAGTVPGGSA
jgi:alkylation response protein AidB-like acyl-CoA dehydrogenase